MNIYDLVDKRIDFLGSEFSKEIDESCENVVNKVNTRYGVDEGTIEKLRKAVDESNKQAKENEKKFRAMLASKGLNDAEIEVLVTKIHQQADALAKQLVDKKV